ncbi:flagellar rod assembly protein/muramidase FlgJ [Rhodanobacter thiooxydans]|uniref:Peptidoglycan hydrolase FlgJ n=1 Tax=Rhodanobacter thiooxydans TaxID=416169 RepID=A0A154QHQ7_9GAMM|nr:flagellar assembly peptidoglycan hydrolase FlgJ [Rhodanobacter thiooxydans]EIM02232.1 flagellar rod assembly protein/muramidase FlgJ [Rhodanobacter thiooxydans LCS2]KZC23771.1 flagellar rod assembly protein/muramidase FlgJ [Rhodanobacter thiooxydans]MCW0200545.1 flagellar assembly peptidoglycan hydrolase FlgJ [Rhodanobacter thiooxydans]
MTPIASNAPALDTWTELSGFQQLRAQARSDDGKSALPAVAKQFEAIFTQMMLKSMRDANASMGSDLAGSEQVDSYREMFDHQLALSLANGNNGLGIAKMLVRQLGGKPAAAAEAHGPLPTPVAGVPNADVRALLQLGAGDDASDATAGIMAMPSTADAGSAWSQTLDRMAQGALDAAGAAAELLPGGDPVGFVRTLAPHAEVAAKQLGVSVRALLAQAALETGWGKHLPSHRDGSSSFNLFGIKAGGNWSGDKVSVPTLEYENGVAVRRRDAFRAYDSPADAFADYARVLADSPRYAQALGQGENVAGFARALVRGGYATDPSYAAKITAIANSPQMREALAALRLPREFK